MNWAFTFYNLVITSKCVYLCMVCFQVDDCYLPYAGAVCTSDYFDVKHGNLKIQTSELDLYSWTLKHFLFG